MIKRPKTALFKALIGSVPVINQRKIRLGQNLAWEGKVFS